MECKLDFIKISVAHFSVRPSEQKPQSINRDIANYSPNPQRQIQNEK